MAIGRRPLTDKQREAVNKRKREIQQRKRRKGAADTLHRMRRKAGRAHA